jgi:hypothetical protein
MTLYNPEWEMRFLKLALLERKEKALAIAEELREIMKPVNLSAMFDEFLKGALHSAHHHTDSYAHDNGFDKIILFQDPTTKMKMRLHIWHPLALSNVRRPRQNVHNHRWDFSSGILIGNAENHVYQLAVDDEAGEPFFHYRYFARGSKEHYVLEKMGTENLVIEESRRVAAGDIYSVEAEMLHRVDTPGDELIATLVITHENIGWVTNDLLSERKLEPNQGSFSSPAMSRKQIVDKVQGLRKKLKI